jgi:hypothetical protein
MQLAVGQCVASCQRRQESDVSEAEDNAPGRRHNRDDRKYSGSGTMFENPRKQFRRRFVETKAGDRLVNRALVLIIAV